MSRSGLDFRTRRRLVCAGRLIKLVVTEFLRNKGFLLAGAVAYNTLLSLIPLVAVLLVVLSHFFDQERLLAVIMQQADFIVPKQAEFLHSDLQGFLENRRLVGWIGAGVLLFFSSLAFRTLEGAMEVIFHVKEGQRRIWISMVIPYAFICVLGLALLLLTGMKIALDSLSEAQVGLFLARWSVADVTGVVIYVFGLAGLIALFTAIYLFMPCVHVRPTRALVGGLTAACLWELTRLFLVWWFTNLSLVNVIYGSLAAAVTTLLTLEVAAVILLLGAQVIAVLEGHGTGAAGPDG